jgi:hypothetical protein
MTTNTISADQMIEKLAHDWNQLSDIDRALSLTEIKKSGLSSRRIATMLGRNESLIRRLLILLSAPAADLAAARQGRLSTNKLLRRARAQIQRQAARQQADRQQEHQRQTAEAAQLISNWLNQTELYGPACEDIVNEVRWEFAAREAGGARPAPPKVNVALDEIIRRSKPAEDPEIDIVAWYAQWLCGWTFFAFSNPDIRDQALDLALQQQCRR